MVNYWTYRQHQVIAYIMDCLDFLSVYFLLLK